MNKHKRRWHRTDLHREFDSFLNVAEYSFHIDRDSVLTCGAFVVHSKPNPKRRGSDGSSGHLFLFPTEEDRAREMQRIIRSPKTSSSSSSSTKPAVHADVKYFKCIRPLKSVSRPDGSGVSYYILTAETRRRLSAKRHRTVRQQSERDMRTPSRLAIANRSLARLIQAK
jgi:hypothetical protein